MRLPCRRAIVARGENPFVAYEDTPHKGAIAGAPFGDREGDFHKVRIPIRAHRPPPAFRFRRLYCFLSESSLFLFCFFAVQ